MNRCIRLLIVSATTLINSVHLSASCWQGDSWQGIISPAGVLESLSFHSDSAFFTIPFMSKGHAEGPSFYINMGDKDSVAVWQKVSDNTFVASIDKVVCHMEYLSMQGMPAIRIEIENRGYVPFEPMKAGIKTGIDTYMDKYPAWNDKFFPTLMYNEKTHFYGYLQSPSGHMVALASSDPIASWSVDYNLGYQDPAPHWFMGHRILSLNLDLMNTLPLPARNPQNLWRLDPGEKKTWTIMMFPTTLQSLEKDVNRLTGNPLISMEETNYDVDTDASLTIYGNRPVVKVCLDDGDVLPSNLRHVDGSRYCLTFHLPKIGLYHIALLDGNKEAEAILTVHPSWEWCMDRAREATLKYKQKATSHAESWYGFYSAFIAARCFPNPVLDKQLADRFEYLFNLLHDPVTGEPKYYKGRIQNTSTTIGMLVAKYLAYHDIKDITRASKLADWLIDFSQAKNGGYMNGRTLYTSVLYIAKSLMELQQVEQQLGQRDNHWASQAKKYYASVQRAIDQLVNCHGDFETEGEMTFEDGMESCSALQIGMFALLQKDKAKRKHYTDAMLEILGQHNCLTQLRVPDARRRGGTMRYWEAQYDVQMLPNMFNSPHGWSAWRCYATYYAYLLTGNPEWLTQTFNAVGAFSNLLNHKSGKLHWAFVVDPYLRVKQTCEPDLHITADSLSFGNPHPELYPMKEFVIGEQYVNMISDWQGVNTQDNDVHEVFKCIGETVLTHAFIYEDSEGKIHGINCKVSRNGNNLEVKENEKQITSLHCNLHHAFSLSFRGQKYNIKKSYMGWINRSHSL